MSGRNYLRALIAIALADYVLIPGAMTLADIAGLLPATAAAVYVPPLMGIGVALVVAAVAWRRAGETGASRLWALPLVLWVATTGAFEAAAPLSMVALVAAGHASAGAGMLSEALAPVSVLVFLGLYRPPARRWLGQRVITGLVLVALAADFLIRAPRILGVLGGWLNLAALARPDLGGPASTLLAGAFALAPAADALAALDHPVAGLPAGVHTLVLVGGLVMLAAEGEWGSAARDGTADLVLAPDERR